MKRAGGERRTDERGKQQVELFVRLLADGEGRKGEV